MEKCVTKDAEGRMAEKERQQTPHELAYEHAIWLLKYYGFEFQKAPEREFPLAMKEAADYLARARPKPSEVTCESLLVPFVLAMLLVQSKDPQAYLFGYHVFCPSLKRRFTAWQGWVYAISLEPTEVDIPVTF